MKKKKLTNKRDNTREIMSIALLLTGEDVLHLLEQPQGTVINGFPGLTFIVEGSEVLGQQVHRNPIGQCMLDAVEIIVADLTLPVGADGITADVNEQIGIPINDIGMRKCMTVTQTIQRP